MGWLALHFRVPHTPEPHIDSGGSARRRAGSTAGSSRRTNLWARAPSSLMHELRAAVQPWRCGQLPSWTALPPATWGRRRSTLLLLAYYR